ncbi:MAG: hypothetical protein ACRC1N_06945 [Aeromonas sobria]
MTLLACVLFDALLLVDGFCCDGLIPLIPSPSPLIYGKEWEKGAQIAAILEWRDSYGYKLAGTCSLSLGRGLG